MSAYFFAALLGKLTLILIAGLSLDLLWRRKWVLLTAAMWNALLVALVAMPIAALLAPDWRVPLLAAAAEQDELPMTLAVASQKDQQDLTLQTARDATRDSSISPERAAQQILAQTSVVPTAVNPAHSGFPIDSLGILGNWSLAAPALGCLYALGLAMALIRLLCAWHGVHDLRRHAVPLTNPRWLASFDYWQARLQLGPQRPARAIRLLETNAFDVPAAVGVRRRAVLIPARAARDLGDEAMDAILLHELTHFARADCAWQALQRFVEAILWFHPLVRLAARRISFIRERACDDFAVHVLGDSRSYIETLLDVARHLTRRPSLALGLAVLRSGKLESRLRALQTSGGNPRMNAPRAVRVILSIFAVAGSTLLASLALSRAQADPPSQPAAAADADAKTKDEMTEIQQLKASFARLHKIAFTALERTDATTTATPNGVADNRQWFKVARDGDKWAVLVKKTGTMLFAGTPRGYATFQNVVFNGQQAIQINQANAGALSQVDDPQKVPLPTESKSMLVMGSIDGSPPMAGVYPIGFLDTGKLIFGRLNATDDLEQRLAGAKIDAARSLPELPGCVAVSNTGDFGTMTAWLDPQHGFLPKRIELRKTASDKMGDTVINQIPPRDDGVRGFWPNTQMTGFSQVIDHITFADLAGVPVIASAIDSWTYTYEGDQHVTFRHEFAAQDFHRPQPSEIALTIQVPDHTVVLMHGRRDSGYQWYQGKIVRDEDAQDQAAQAAGPAQRTIRVQVLSSSGEPAAGAKIHAAIWAKDPPKGNTDYRTDEAGRATINIPRNPRIVRLWVSLPKHVEQFINWSPEEQNTRIDNIPDEFTFRLQPGTFIHGFVKDDAGQPISGVKVQAKLVQRTEPTAAPIPSIWLAEGAGARITDEHGVWLLDNVPDGDGVEVEIMLSHPDYLSDYAWGQSQKQQGVTTQSLREGTGTVVLHRGTSVQGTVVGPDDKPVAGAVVVWGDDPYLQQGSQEERTDREGHYRFPPLPDGPLTLTVVAQGFAPMQKKVIVKSSMDPANFRLEPGKTIRIRFVDKAGAAVPGVYVGIDRWRGGKGLYNHRHPNVIDTGIPYQANDQGIYEWTWAPEDPVTFHFGKDGYDDIRERAFSPGDETVILR